MNFVFNPNVPDGKFIQSVTKQDIKDIAEFLKGNNISFVEIDLECFCKNGLKAMCFPPTATKKDVFAEILDYAKSEINYYGQNSYFLDEYKARHDTIIMGCSY